VTRTPEHLFNATATLLRARVNQDRTGGVVVQYDPAGTFKCRVQITGMSEGREVHGDDVTYSATMFCGMDVAISDRDRVQIGSTIYKVGGVNPNQGTGIFQTVNLTDSL